MCRPYIPIPNKPLTIQHPINRRSLNLYNVRRTNQTHWNARRTHRLRREYAPVATSTHARLLAWKRPISLQGQGVNRTSFWQQARKALERNTASADRFGTTCQSLVCYPGNCTASRKWCNLQQRLGCRFFQPVQTNTYSTCSYTR